MPFFLRCQVFRGKTAHFLEECPAQEFSIRTVLEILRFRERRPGRSADGSEVLQQTPEKTPRFGRSMQTRKSVPFDVRPFTDTLSQFWCLLAFRAFDS